MNNSDQKGEGKKKVNEIKTFPVPFALGEIKDNISISTNTPSKPSKEQIINQAFKFHSEGNISEAAKLYQYFINQGFKDHRVFSNYGVILQNLGKLQEAFNYFLKAIGKIALHHFFFYSRPHNTETLLSLDLLLSMNVYIYGTTIREFRSVRY